MLLIITCVILFEVYESYDDQRLLAIYNNRPTLIYIMLE